MTAHERILEALIKLLLRRGDLDALEVDAVADELEQSDETAAHLLRVMLIEAAAPAQSDWQAGKARARFRVIEGERE